ncbi:hypothetical protein F4860DRAFT_521296 [Xylaria cubensis]|nr:hypothetical protein F4860DRAFT_521296 [Xylaria cubensis]
MGKKVNTSPPSRHAKNRENALPSTAKTPITKTPTTKTPTRKTPTRKSPKSKAVERGLDASYEPYANLIIKIYLDKKLHSIYDRAAKKFIYHAKQELYSGYTVVCSNEGYCNAVYDEEGKRVYAKGQR